MVTVSLHPNDDGWAYCFIDWSDVMLGLSLLIAIGIIASIVVLSVGSRYDCRHIALFTSLVSIGVFFYLTPLIDFSQGSIMLIERYDWIPF